MTQLNNENPAQSYGDLLTTTNGGQGLSNVLQQLQDGYGNASTVTIATDSINFNRQGGNTFELDGVALTATAASLNQVSGNNPVFPGTAGIVVPSGTTAQRVAVAGTIRLNTQLVQFEGYNGVAWVVLG